MTIPSLSPSETSPTKSRVTTAKRYGIFVVEDHAITRLALVALINDEADLYVCGEADSATDALVRIAKLEPAAVIADITLRSGNGIELMQKLILLCPGVPVLAISGHDENVFGERALQAGARGYLAKGAGAEKIVPAIRTILSGQIYRPDQLKQKNPMPQRTT
ncbi:MAG: response regulator transcription factor [Opitutaceae bacterium]